MDKKVDKDCVAERQMTVIEPALKDKNNNWYKLVKSLYTDTDMSVLRKIFENVRELSAKCYDAAQKWAPISDELWEEKHASTCNTAS